MSNILSVVMILENRNIFYNQLKKILILILTKDWCIQIKWLQILSNSIEDILHLFHTVFKTFSHLFGVTAVILKWRDHLNFFSPMTPIWSRWVSVTTDFWKYNKRFICFFFPISWLCLQINHQTKKNTHRFSFNPPKALSNCKCVLHLKRASL